MKPITLIDVYEQYPDNILVVLFLYDLLAERDPVANISHRGLPTFDCHRDFVSSRPYKAWYIIQAGSENVGATYITSNDEIGIFISKSHQGNGYGAAAVRILMAMHPAARFLANIAPGNERSHAMFEKLGFKICQHTLELRTK